VIDINHKKIMFEKGVKFLVLYLEADLKWNHQVEAIRQKCVKHKTIVNYWVFRTQADWTWTHTSHEDTEESTTEASITLDGVTLTH
jgi:hypothetical protein